MNKCLFCYRELEEGQKDFHPACAKKFFGKTEAPNLPYSRDNINDLARESVLSISGVMTAKTAFCRVFCPIHFLPL